jgi:hypothetical protein
MKPLNGGVTPKVLIIHHSRMGNSEAMAVEKDVGSEGIDVQCKDVKEIMIEELLEPIR